MFLTSRVAVSAKPKGAQSAQGCEARLDSAVDGVQNGSDGVQNGSVDGAGPSKLGDGAPTNAGKETNGNAAEQSEARSTHHFATLCCF